MRFFLFNFSFVFSKTYETAFKMETENKLLQLYLICTTGHSRTKLEYQRHQIKEIKYKKSIFKILYAFNILTLLSTSFRWISRAFVFLVKYLGPSRSYHVNRDIWTIHFMRYSFITQGDIHSPRLFDYFNIYFYNPLLLSKKIHVNFTKQLWALSFLHFTMQQRKMFLVPNRHACLQHFTLFL